MIEVDRLTPEQWKNHSEAAHAVCFGKHKPAEWDRIDFVLVAREEERLLGYVTCREMDAQTLYWQFGGAFPGTRGTSVSWQVYQALVEYCKPKYMRIATLIENKNSVMLKMAAKIGYLIIGVRAYQGDVLVEHLLEFGGPDGSSTR